MTDSRFKTIPVWYSTSLTIAASRVKPNYLIASHDEMRFRVVCK